MNSPDGVTIKVDGRTESDSKYSSSILSCLQVKYQSCETACGGAARRGGGGGVRFFNFRAAKNKKN